MLIGTSKSKTNVLPKTQPITSKQINCGVDQGWTESAGCLPTILFVFLPENKLLGHNCNYDNDWLEDLERKKKVFGGVNVEWRTGNRNALLTR